MLSVRLLTSSRSLRISSSLGYWFFCGAWFRRNGEKEKPEICSGQSGALTGRLISAQKPVNSAARATITTRLRPSLLAGIGRWILWSGGAAGMLPRVPGTV
ncbi:hypothetical protein D9M73_293370 [compost metagenome]